MKKNTGNKIRHSFAPRMLSEETETLYPEVLDKTLEGLSLSCSPGTRDYFQVTISYLQPGHRPLGYPQKKGNPCFNLTLNVWAENGDHAKELALFQFDFLEATSNTHTLRMVKNVSVEKIEKT